MIPDIQGIHTGNVSVFRAKVARGGTVRALAIRIRGIRAWAVHIGAVRAQGRQGGDGLMVKSVGVDDSDVFGSK